jgi:hypothetical protein
VVSWNCSDSVVFWNCSDSVVFWNCSKKRQHRYLFHIYTRLPFIIVRAKVCTKMKNKKRSHFRNSSKL